MPSALIQHQQNYSPMASPSAFNNSETDPHKDPWYPFSNGAHFNSNIAMILIFIFCALICALAINAVVRFFLRISDQEEEDSDRKPAPEASSTTLQSLPTLVFSSGTKLHLAGAGAEGGTAECAICLSEFVDGDSVRILPKCKHGFHVKCIQGWLSSHVSCPTCRTHYDVESPPPPPPILSLPPAAAASTPSLQLQPLQIAGAGEHHQSPAAVASVPPLQVQVSE